MNEQSAWRLASAREIAAIYSALPAVRAILVGGSVAQGWADRFSDVEIGVFWDALPSREEHETRMHAAGGQSWELDPFDPATELVQYEEYAVHGLKIDLRHMTVDAMERILRSVVDEGDLDPDRQEIVFAVRHGIPLHGEPLLRRWRERADGYPDVLIRSQIEARLDLPPWWSVPMYAARGDLPLFYQAVTAAAERVLAALCALNREYFSGLKWALKTLECLPIQPPESAERLRAIFRDDPAAAAEAMRVWIEETFDLAERLVPDLDLSRQRADFRAVRPVLEAP